MDVGILGTCAPMCVSDTNGRLSSVSAGTVCVDCPYSEAVHMSNGTDPVKMTQGSFEDVGGVRCLSGYTVL